MWRRVSHVHDSFMPLSGSSVSGISRRRRLEAAAWWVVCCTCPVSLPPSSGPLGLSSALSRLFDFTVVVQLRFWAHTNRTDFCLQLQQYPSTVVAKIIAILGMVQNILPANMTSLRIFPSDECAGLCWLVFSPLQKDKDYGLFDHPLLLTLRFECAFICLSKLQQSPFRPALGSLVRFSGLTPWERGFWMLAPAGWACSGVAGLGPAKLHFSKLIEMEISWNCKTNWIVCD